MQDARNQEERALFEEAMADVAPLEQDGHVPEIVYRPPVTLSEHEREVLREFGSGHVDNGSPAHRESAGWAGQGGSRQRGF